MHRFLLRTLNFAVNHPVSVYESCVSISKCEKAAASAFRVANGGGVKALSTSSYRHCEKKDDVTTAHQEEKTNAVEDVVPTETATLLTQKAEGEITLVKKEEHNEEPVVLKTDDAPSHQEEKTNAVEDVVPTETATLLTPKAEGEITLVKKEEQNEEPVVLKTDGVDMEQQQADVRVEEVVEPPKQVKSPAANSGKQSLLDLLGAMKVEVTNKSKLKSKKTMSPRPESIPKPNLAAMESTISMFQQATGEAASQSEALDSTLVAAASAAASTLPNSSQAESELLRQLRKNDSVTEAQKKGDTNNLGVIIADMKVGKRYNRQSAKPANQIWFDDDGKGYTLERGITAELDGVRRRRPMFSGKRLNVFSPATAADSVETTVARPTLWDMDFANQLSLSTSQFPRNGLEEMIQWSKEGKLWRYPINNEAGLEEEVGVSFQEHIYLDRHLEEGFPSQGPVRHFMELVVAGLSRNPYLTVQQKREHISWFRDYFHQKEEVLKEADVYLR